MIDARILGGMELSGSGTGVSDPSALLSQPKPTALFVYLLLARPGVMQRRDALAAMLWPEADQKRARGALSQTLYVIRRHLGPAVLLTRGTEDVGITPDGVGCDALQFLRLLKEGERERALTLYGGDLLPSFYLPHTPAFEHWLEAERARLRRSAVEAAWRLADEAEAGTDAAVAARWSRWAARMSPHDEAALRRMMEMLSRLGDRSGALAEFERYRKRLQAEMELEPESATSALAAAILSAGKRGEGPSVPSEALAPSAGRAPDASEDTGSPSPESPGTPSITPDSVGGAEGQRNPLSPRRARRLRRSAAWIMGAAALVTFAFQLRNSSAGPAHETIAVFPFRVVSSDTSLAYLSEGMADLISGAFTGETGPRAVDMRAAVFAMQEAAAKPTEAAGLAARRLGARSFVDGVVAVTPENAVVQATLVESSSGLRIGSVREVGEVDDYLALAHRVASALMGLATGGEDELLAAGFDAPWPAARAYLKGQMAYRRGDFYLASRHFQEAVNLDSTFSPAAFGLLLATGWTSNAAVDGPRARRLAWQTRDGLPAREREYVEALIGTPRANFSGVYDVARTLERWTEYAERWGDRPDGWYELGDRHLHGGAMAGHADYLDTAERAFRRAIRLDSTFAPAALHLVDILVDRVASPRFDGGAPRSVHEELQSLAERYFTAVAPYARYHTAEAWRAAMALGDEEWLARIRPRMDSMPEYELHQIIRSTQAYGWRQGDARRALEALDRIAFRRLGALVTRTHLYLNAGQPGLAEAAVDEVRRLFPERPVHLFMRVEAALLGDGDPGAAARAALELERLAAAPAAPDLDRRHDQVLAGFYSEVWKLTHGGSPTVAMTVERIRNGLIEDTAAATLRPLGEFYTEFLDALYAATRQQPEALDRAVRTDSILLRHWGESAYAWTPWFVLENSGPMLMVLLHRVRDDEVRALEAARRRGVLYNSSGEVRYLSARLLIEARMAARAGDTKGARRAYRHYLALRPDPEPRLLPLRREIQAELSALEGRR